MAAETMPKVMEGKIRDAGTLDGAIKAFPPNEPTGV
jgi:hypothetical protein